MYFHLVIIVPEYTQVLQPKVFLYKKILKR
nr:MAG TPA: hypothetical protein [Caudoviricetes sp.]